MIGVVAAMAAEARFLGTLRRGSNGLRVLPDDTLVSISGMGFNAAADGARSLVRGGATALVSWGLAGGLDPSLRAGTVLLPVRILCTGATDFPTSAGWRERLLELLTPQQGVIGGLVLSSPVAIDATERKRELFRQTGAVAVDMESAAIARVAAEHGLPFIALRVIVDTAADSLPTAVLAASTNGEVSVARLIEELIRAPSQLMPLLRLVQRYTAAKHSLRAIAPILRRVDPLLA